MERGGGSGGSGGSGVDAVNRNRRIRITREHPLLPSFLRELKGTCAGGS